MAAARPVYNSVTRVSSVGSDLPASGEGPSVPDEVSPLLKPKRTHAHRQTISERWRATRSSFLDDNLGLLLVAASQFFFSAMGFAVKWLNSLDDKDLPPLLRRPLKQNKSALRQHRKTLIKARWNIEWKASTRATKTNDIDPSLPSNKYLKLISDDRISRTDASRIFQLRSAHIPLNAYLERFKRVDNARCPACGHPKENVQHFLFDCPKYSYERWALLKHCKKRNPKLEDILNKSKMIVPLANFIQATGRFDQELNNTPSN